MQIDLYYDFKKAILESAETSNANWERASYLYKNLIEILHTGNIVPYNNPPFSVKSKSVNIQNDIISVDLIIEINDKQELLVIYFRNEPNNIISAKYNSGTIELYIPKFEATKYNAISHLESHDGNRDFIHEAMHFFDDIRKKRMDYAKLTGYDLEDYTRDGNEINARFIAKLNDIVNKDISKLTNADIVNIAKTEAPKIFNIKSLNKSREFIELRKEKHRKRGSFYKIKDEKILKNIEKKIIEILLYKRDKE